MDKTTEALSQNSIMHNNLEIVNCFILVEMNCHSLERTIKLRVLQVLVMVCYHRCNFFKLKIELIDIELIVIELIDTELIVIELINL